MKQLSCLFTIIFILGIFGEVLSIIKFCNCDFEPSYKAEIIYGVSAITGVGAVTGYFNFGK